MHSLHGGIHYKDAPFVFNIWQPLCSLFIEQLVLLAVADLEEGPGGPAPPPFILGKKRRNDWRENGWQGK